MWVDVTHISNRATHLEVWKKGLGADKMRFQRSISGHTLRAHMYNATIRGKFGVANIVEDTEKYRRQCTGHLERTENNPIT
jgi:hypothetical protein